MTWVMRNPARFERNKDRFRDTDHYCQESAYLDVGGLDLTPEDEYGTYNGSGPASSPAMSSRFESSNWVRMWIRRFS